MRWRKAGTAPHNQGPDNLEGGYRFRVVTVTEAVENAVAGQWDVPEFQREFVWKPEQVCALADSLWLNYPIGNLLLWQAKRDGEVPLWIADGQQRLTALCLLHGTAPSWLGRKPDDVRARMRQRFDIRFDVSRPDGPRFVVANEAADTPLIPTGRLMAIDPASRRGIDEFERMAREFKKAGCCRGADESEIRERLVRVSMMARRELVVTLVDHRHRDDVLDIFARLNSRGMRFRRLLVKLAMEEVPAAIRGMRARFQP